MAKCRLLHQENEELGKMISSGRVAKLEGELALQKSFSEEVKKSQFGERHILFWCADVVLRILNIPISVLIRIGRIAARSG